MKLTEREKFLLRAGANQLQPEYFTEGCMGSYSYVFCHWCNGRVYCDDFPDFIYPEIDDLVAQIKHDPSCSLKEYQALIEKIFLSLD